MPCGKLQSAGLTGDLSLLPLEDNCDSANTSDEDFTPARKPGQEVLFDENECKIVLNAWKLLHDKAKDNPKTCEDVPGITTVSKCPFIDKKCNAGALVLKVTEIKWEQNKRSRLGKLFRKIKPVNFELLKFQKLTVIERVSIEGFKLIGSVPCGTIQKAILSPDISALELKANCMVNKNAKTVTKMEDQDVQEIVSPKKEDCEVIVKAWNILTKSDQKCEDIQGITTTSLCPPANSSCLDIEKINLVTAIDWKMSHVKKNHIASVFFPKLQLEKLEGIRNMYRTF